MRILHTSDWHLGRQFHGVSLLEDQAAALDQVVAAARGVDVMIVAGDIFDRSIPPAAAVTLLDDVLQRVAVDLGVPVILIPGNHDGAERLGFGARAMERSGIHIRSRFDFDPVVIDDTHGPVRFHCLPYADPATVSDRLGRPLGSHDEAMAALVSECLGARRGAGRDVLVAHCFVAGGASRESERPLSVGGVDAVSVRHFEPFHYAALGHLHGAQSFLGGRVRYPGSLLKYSFSEAADVKGVLMVEVEAGGGVAVRPVPLAPLRDMRVIEGNLDALLGAGAADAARDDYLLVRLDDTRAILDVMAKLRAVYPNVLHVERPALERAGERTRPAADHRGTGELPMFDDFWQQVTGEPLGDDRRVIVARALDAIHRGEDS